MSRPSSIVIHRVAAEVAWDNRRVLSGEGAHSSNARSPRSGPGSPLATSPLGVLTVRAPSATRGW